MNKINTLTRNEFIRACKDARAGYRQHTVYLDKQNRCISSIEGIVTVYYHGNKVARYYGETDTLELYTEYGHYPSTKALLNALNGKNSFSSKKGILYYEGSPVATEESSRVTRVPFLAS